MTSSAVSNVGNNNLNEETDNDMNTETEHKLNTDTDNDLKNLNKLDEIMTEILVCFTYC